MSSRCSARRSTAATNRSRKSARQLDAYAGANRARRPRARRRCVGRFHRTVPRHRPGVGLPPAPGAVDQRVGPQVRPRVSGRRLGRVAQSRGAARGPRVPRQLPRRRDADLRAELLAAGKPDRRAVLQLHSARLRGLPRIQQVATRRRDCTRRASIAELGPFELITDGSELPVFAFKLNGRGQRTTRCSRSPTGCAKPAGSCRRTRSPTTAPTSPRSAS